MEKNIGIKIEKKNSELSTDAAELENIVGNEQPKGDLDAWIEVQPKRRTRTLSSKFVFNPGKGKSNWVEIQAMGGPLQRMKNMTNLML